MLDIKKPTLIQRSLYTTNEEWKFLKKLSDKKRKITGLPYTRNSIIREWIASEMNKNNDSTYKKAGGLDHD